MSPYELAIKAVSEAVIAVCHLQEVQLQNASQEQKDIQSKIMVEVLKPFLSLLTFFNKALEKQLDK